MPRLLRRTIRTLLSSLLLALGVLSIVVLDDPVQVGVGCAVAALGLGSVLYALLGPIPSFDESYEAAMIDGFGLLLFELAMAVIACALVALIIIIIIAHAI